MRKGADWFGAFCFHDRFSRILAAA